MMIFQLKIECTLSDGLLKRWTTLIAEFLGLGAKALVCELKLYAENFGSRAKAQCVIFGVLS